MLSYLKKNIKQKIRLFLKRLVSTFQCFWTVL